MEQNMSDTPVVEIAENEVPVEETPVEETPKDPAEPKAEEEKKPEEPKTEEKKLTHDERRWQRLLKERAEYKAKVDLYEQMQAQQKAQPDKSDTPQRDKYGSDEEYVQALTAHIVKQQLSGVKQELAQHQTQSKTQAEWLSKINQARTDYPDYDTVMEDAVDIPIEPAVAEAIQSSDLGGDIAYYLAKNPEEALRINSLTPMVAAREIGRIESYVEYEKTQAKKVVPVSKAPSPIKPVKPSSSPGTKSLEDMSVAEYTAYMNKREQERRKKGRF